VSLASDQDNVPRCGRGDGPGNRTASVKLNALRSAKAARLNLRGDAIGGLGSRVITGDDEAITRRRHHLTHQGSLALVTIATGTKHTPQKTAPGMSQHAQRG
jgi:hypothetical protein